MPTGTKLDPNTDGGDRKPSAAVVAADDADGTGDCDAPVVSSVDHQQVLTSIVSPQPNAAFLHTTTPPIGNENYDHRDNDTVTCVTNQHENNIKLIKNGAVGRVGSVAGVTYTDDDDDDDDANEKKKKNTSEDDKDILDILANTNLYVAQQDMYDMKRIEYESTLPQSSPNENTIGAFCMNGPSHRNRRNDDECDDDDDSDPNPSHDDGNDNVRHNHLPGSMATAVSHNRNVTVEENNNSTSLSHHLLNATLVDDIIIVTAVAAPDHPDTTNTNTTNARRYCEPSPVLTKITLVLCIITLVVVGNFFAISGIRSKSSTPPPDDSDDDLCFTDGVELKKAVREYLWEYETVKKKYGTIGSWCVGKVSDFSELFNANNFGIGASAFNEDISLWNTSSGTTMAGMFRNATEFNKDLSGWDVSSVTDMIDMFSNAESFNGDLSRWDVSRVTKMDYMFANTMFNGNITQWNTSSAKSMIGMFSDAFEFNRDISSWNVSSVTNMTEMFYFASSYKGDMSPWDVSRVIQMDIMFFGAHNFNGNISLWNTSSVKSMAGMFEYAHLFNQDISGWNVSSVTNMNGMFSAAESFNGDVSTWDVSNVQSMQSMFAGATSFNGNLSTWNVSNLYDAVSMFEDATNFNQSLCAWGYLLNSPGAPGITSSMFRNAESCPNTSDPDYSQEPHGPFCHECS